MLKRKLRRLMFTTSIVVILCGLSRAQSPPPASQFEVYCQTGSSPLPPNGWTLNPSTGKFRAWLCVDPNGAVTSPAFPDPSSPGAPSLSVQGNNSGVFAGIPGSAIDFTNGLLSLGPTGTGEALQMTGDATGSAIMEIDSNALTSPGNSAVFGNDSGLIISDNLGDATQASPLLLDVSLVDGASFSFQSAPGQPNLLVVGDNTGVILQSWEKNTTQVAGMDQNGIFSSSNFSTGSGFAGAYVNPMLALNANVANIAPAPSSNTVIVQMFNLPWTQTIQHISVDVVSGNGAGDLWGFGIYSLAGDKLVASGAISTASTGVATNTLGSAVTLPAGTYYFAETTSGATALSNYYAFDKTHAVGVLNALAIRSGTAANPSTAGVLPATLGTITPANTSTYYDPIYVWFEP